MAKLDVLRVVVKVENHVTAIFEKIEEAERSTDTDRPCRMQELRELIIDSLLVEVH
jgi:hypothetical protein